MSFIKKFVGFIGHYGNELAVVTDLLGTVIGSLPLNKSEKDRFTAMLEGLEKSVKNITASLPEIKKLETATVKKSDVEAAVATVLPKIVESELKKLLASKELSDAIAAHVKSATDAAKS